MQNCRITYFEKSEVKTEAGVRPLNQHFLQYFTLLNKNFVKLARIFLAFLDSTQEGTRPRLPSCDHKIS